MPYPLSMAPSAQPPSTPSTYTTTTSSNRMALPQFHPHGSASGEPFHAASAVYASQQQQHLFQPVAAAALMPLMPPPSPMQRNAVGMGSHTVGGIPWGGGGASFPQRQAELPPSPFNFNLNTVGEGSVGRRGETPRFDGGGGGGVMVGGALASALPLFQAHPQQPPLGQLRAHSNVQAPYNHSQPWSQLFGASC